MLLSFLLTSFIQSADNISAYFQPVVVSRLQVPRLTIKKTKRERRECHREGRTCLSWNVKLPTTVVAVISILGHSELLIYLFYSVSHFPFTRSEAFHITVRWNVPIVPPLEIKLHEMSIWNKLWKKKKKWFRNQPKGRWSGGGEWGRGEGIRRNWGGRIGWKGKEGGDRDVKSVKVL